MTSEQSPAEPLEIVVDPEQEGMRLDVLLARRFPEYSRVHLRRVIDAAAVLVDGQPAKVAYKLHVGQQVRITLPDLPRTGPVPEDIPLAILYEDEHLAAIDKPAGMVVHPAKGNWKGTLAGALAFHFDRLSTSGGSSRPGIVHRLDRDTSGVIVVAKTDAAHVRLAAQFEARTTEKEYLAITAGVPDWDRGIVDHPIGAHPTHREKMALRRDDPTSREAQTYYEVVERFSGFAYVRALPKTGRTHQIRLHLMSLRTPVLCDKLYSGRSQLLLGELTRDPTLTEVLLGRQALHARRLRLAHPITGEPLEFEAPVPAELQRTLEALRQYRPLAKKTR